MSQQAVPHRQPFVGRQREAAWLRAAFDEASLGHGGVALVEGEPGVGKTALCGQISAYAARGGGAVLVGHCYEGRWSSLPYMPLVEALGSHTTTVEPDALGDVLGHGASAVARLMPQ